MITLTKPMLASPLLKPSDKHDDDTIYRAMKSLRYPVIATLKIDGIRGLVTDNLRSRTLKLIPNDSIRARANSLVYGLDLELYNGELRYDEIESIVMSQEHPLSDKIMFNLLDDFSAEQPYEWRLQSIKDFAGIYKHANCSVVFDEWCGNADELFAFEKRTIETFGEGICFRTPDSPYKQGRSTLKEQYLVKLCRFVREEVTIIGFEEQMHNSNSERRNPIGMMNSSSSKSGLLGKNTLGAFLVRNSDGLEFTVGTGVGLTDKLRVEIWLNQDKWLDKQCVIKHKAHGRMKKPRSPIWVGMREKGF